MAAFQLEPLGLKVLPASNTKSYETPFRELSAPAMAPVPEEAPKNAPASRVQELEQMLAESQGRAAEIEQEAYDKAYAAGEKAGMALGQKRAEQILERMQLLLQETEQQFADIRYAAGETIIDMSAQLSAWLIGELTSKDRSRLVALAEKTAHSLSQPEGIKIAVSPQDYSDFEKLMEGSEHAFPLIAEEGVATGMVRVFNKSQDVLVDPQAALADAVAGLKAELLKDCDEEGASHGRP